MQAEAAYCNLHCVLTATYPITKFVIDLSCISKAAAEAKAKADAEAKAAAEKAAAEKAASEKTAAAKAAADTKV